MEQNKVKKTIVPIIPLKSVVFFPNVITPIYVGREISIEALKYAQINDTQLILATQKDAEVEVPTKSSLYKTAVLAEILEVNPLPEGQFQLLVSVSDRVKLTTSNRVNSKFLSSNFEVIEKAEKLSEKDEKASLNLLVSKLKEFISAFPDRSFPEDLIEKIQNFVKEDGLEASIDEAASDTLLDIEERIIILKEVSLKTRLIKLLTFLQDRLDIAYAEKRIAATVKKQMEKAQKDYYLNEQMKAIQKEIKGSNSEIQIDEEDEQAELLKKIESLKAPKEVLKKVRSEFNKMNLMPPMSSESSVLRSYIDWVLQVPWAKKTKLNVNLSKAEESLNKDHYGLEKVKERIIEYLAVQSKNPKGKGPILCLVGPPGVGKTSLAYSIATATGRKYIRMALGGVHDEAEIRGHRKTYIGAMPGKIIQNMAKAGVNNPLFLLDEIDKVSSDSKGDPASALLEVLDPEQNKAFGDNYLELDYDLSDTLFIATANSFDIPRPLLDRMEIIRLSGYTEAEKFNIARNYLVAKAIKNNALTNEEIEITDEAIWDIIRYYTREAGVRSLEKYIAKICRKVTRKIMQKEIDSKEVIDSSKTEIYLGPKVFDYGKTGSQDQVGEVNGLAWTEVGGELLKIECVAVKGKGLLSFTGSLGDVMKESIKNAMMVVRSRVEDLNLTSDFYEKLDIHVHAPEGATPKDGPSAGIGMCTAIVSAITNNPIKSTVAMTGEMTLTGKVLAIGGLKEKLLAAHRGGIKTAIIPHENVKDLHEIPKDILDLLEIKPVKTIDEVLPIALVNPIK
ncbi:MAG: endopeptidase La [Psittacicella sp.]